MSDLGPSVRTTPPPGGWTGIVRTSDPIALETREALGLPTDRPIVMTGHHAEWWHPGLVAKYIAAARIAERAGGAWSWILVDHKETDPCALDVPVDHDGIPKRTTLHLGTPPDPGSSAMTLPSTACVVPDHLALFDEHRARVEALADAMNERADAPDLLTQWLHAMRVSLSGVVALPDPVRATGVLSSPGGRRLVVAMRYDPHACALPYNRGVARTPEARLNTLHVGVDHGAVELPLWHLRDDGTLGRVVAGDDRRFEHTLAPRALTLTALARWLLCDLFIHGDGGFVYDRVTEDWMRDWKGVELAPKTGVTADLRLDFGVEPPSLDALRGAESAAHDARHASWDEKAAYVRRIEALPRKSPERRRVFGELHAFLDERRHANAHEIDRLRDRASHLRRRHDARATITSRAWPFALFDERAQQRLAEAVREAIR